MRTGVVDKMQSEETAVGVERGIRQGCCGIGWSKTCYTLSGLLSTKHPRVKATRQVGS